MRYFSTSNFLLCHSVFKHITQYTFSVVQLSKVELGFTEEFNQLGHIPEQFTVKLTQLYLGVGGKGGRTEGGGGGTIIPVYKLHTHSNKKNIEKP